MTLSKALPEKGLVSLSVSASPPGLEADSRLDVLSPAQALGKGAMLSIKITLAPVSVQVKAES